MVQKDEAVKLEDRIRVLGGKGKEANTGQQYGVRTAAPRKGTAYKRKGKQDGKGRTVMQRWGEGWEGSSTIDERD